MKVYIKTYGCSFNFSDSEIMAGLIEKSRDHEVVDSIKKADVVIVNSCTVKEKAENKLWRDLKTIKKPVVVAGCVPQAEVNKNKFRDFAAIGTYQIDKVVDVIDGVSRGEKPQYLRKKNLIRVNMPKQRQNPVVQIIQINEGCLGNCDFCKTKFARGHLRSYPIKDIVNDARKAVNDGIKELWLTSQDTACYGYDINTNIVALLKEIIKIPKDFKIRLGMGNPDFLNDYLDELIKVFYSEKIYKFLHIPIQSGSDSVIKAMKRNYTEKDFLKIIEGFKKAHPKITIATDIIVGYPDETDEDFKKSIDLVKKIRFDVLNISRFWYRPHTLAAKKKKLPTLKVKNRGIEMTKTFKDTAAEENKKWQGWKGDILITEKGLGDTWIGRNFAYRPVIVKGNLSLGDIISAKVTKTTHIDLRGEQI